MAYCMCKAALDTFTVSPAKELGPRRITVNSVRPGTTKNETNAAMTQAEVVKSIIADTLLGRVGQPSDVAELVHALAALAGDWVTGQNIEVSGRYKHKSESAPVGSQGDVADHQSNRGNRRMSINHSNPAERACPEGRPRILPMSSNELSGEALELATRLRAAFSLGTVEVPKVMATMLRHPALYRAQVDYFLRRAEAMIGDPRLREIAILRMAWLCQSGYIWGEHVDVGKGAGLTSDDIDRITRGSGEVGWTELEGALIGAVEELRHAAAIGDANWDVLAAHLSEQELIELLIVIGDYQEAASIYNALRVELLEGSLGLMAR